MYCEQPNINYILHYVNYIFNIYILPLYINIIDHINILLLLLNIFITTAFNCFII